MAQCMATTIDNPYNPFTHFDEWLAYDMHNHYNTCGLVAYFSEASRFMDDEDYEYETNQAINRLLELNPYGLHIKVYDFDAEKLIALANKVFKEGNKETTDEQA